MTNEELERRVIEIEEFIKGFSKTVNDSLFIMTKMMIDNERMNVGDPLELKAELVNLKERSDTSEEVIRDICRALSLPGEKT